MTVFIHRCVSIEMTLPYLLAGIVLLTCFDFDRSGSTKALNYVDSRGHFKVCHNIGKLHGYCELLNLTRGRT